MVRSKVTNSSFPNQKFDASNIRIRETLERLPKSDRRLPAVIPIDPDLLWPAVQSGENPDKVGYWRFLGTRARKALRHLARTPKASPCEGRIHEDGRPRIAALRVKEHRPKNLCAIALPERSASVGTSL